MLFNLSKIDNLKDNALDLSKHVAEGVHDVHPQLGSRKILLAIQGCVSLSC